MGYRVILILCLSQMESWGKYENLAENLMDTSFKKTVTIQLQTLGTNASIETPRRTFMVHSLYKTRRCLQLYTRRRIYEKSEFTIDKTIPGGVLEELVLPDKVVTKTGRLDL